jgi:hypothetical protein
MCQVFGSQLKMPFLKEMHSLVAENFLLCFFLPYFTGTVWKFRCYCDGDKEMYNAPSYYVHSVIRNCFFQAWNRPLPLSLCNCLKFQGSQKNVQPWTAKWESLIAKQHSSKIYSVFTPLLHGVVYYIYRLIVAVKRTWKKKFCTEINSDKE